MPTILHRMIDLIPELARLSPRERLDLIEARDWYNARNTATAARFAAEIEPLVVAAVRSNGSGAAKAGTSRRSDANQTGC